MVVKIGHIFHLYSSLITIEVFDTLIHTRQTKSMTHIIIHNMVTLTVQCSVRNLLAK